jgi:hypothetical protein
VRERTDPIPPPVGGEAAYGLSEMQRLDVPAVVRRAEETQRNLTATAKEVRTALVVFAGQTVDLDVIDEMAVAVVARLRERGLL